MSGGPKWCNTCNNTGVVDCMCGEDCCKCGRLTKECLDCNGSIVAGDEDDRQGDSDNEFDDCTTGERTDQ